MSSMTSTRWGFDGAGLGFKITKDTTVPSWMSTCYCHFAAKHSVGVVFPQGGTSQRFGIDITID